MIAGDQFITRFRSHISGTVECFDRVLLSGYLPFWSDGYVNGWVAKGLGIRHKDFIPRMRGLSEELVEFAKKAASNAGVPFLSLQGRHRKEELVDSIARKHGKQEGLLAVLAVQEKCRTVKLVYGKNRPRLVYAYRPCRVVYFYLQHPQFGRMFVRVQTWFPWKIQVYVNGHDWLAEQLRQHRIGFSQYQNAFVSVDDPDRAQELSDQFALLDWTTFLDQLAEQFNPLLAHPWIDGRTYTWVIDQAEYSLDVLFTDRTVLSDLYPRLLDHAVLCFQAPELMTYLGRRLRANFEGDIETFCKKERLPGARIKHRVGDNWLKMYDKFGRMLRVETVINNPKDFRIPHPVCRNGKVTITPRRLGKNVRNFGHYQHIGQMANRRYLDALAAVPDSHTATYEQVSELTQPKRHAERSYAGFNIACKADIEFFVALLAGEHHLRGFRISDLLTRLHPACTSPKEKRRRSLAISRRLKRLHVRGLIAKIPRSHRWKLSNAGQRLLPRVVHLYHKGLLQAA